MISSSEYTFIIAAVLILNVELCICTCAQAEYKINGECCPFCAPGTNVYEHCTEFTSTTCVWCIGSAYTDEPNGLTDCISCTVCNAGQGVKLKTACTQISDTVCEPLEGFYCTDEYRNGCKYAAEHTKCSPGQYVKQKGTAVKDAECAVCADGTFSNGSLHICKQHKKCQDLGLEVITPGTNSTDAVCRKKTAAQLIAVILAAAVTTALAVAGVLTFIIYKKSLSRAEKNIHSKNRKHFYKKPTSIRNTDEP